MAKDTKIVIRGVDRISSTLKKISKNFDKLTKTVGKTNHKLDKTAAKMKAVGQSVQRFGSKAKKAGKSFTMGTTLPVLGFFGLALKKNADFQEQFNKVMAKAKVDGGVTFKSLQKESRRLASESQFTTAQVAEGMAFMAQAGLKTNEIFKTTPAAINLAAASGENLVQVSDVLTNTMAAFGLEADKAGMVSDVMAAALGGANIDLTQFQDTMKFVAPVASQFGASIQDTSAAVGFLGNVGIQGSNAATALKTAFLNLSAPTTKASKILNQLGINVADSEGKMLPFIDIFQQMSESMQDLPQQSKLQVLNEVFGKRGIAGASSLMEKTLGGSNNELARFAKELKNSQGAAERMKKVMEKGLPGAIAKLNSAFEGLLLKLGFEGGFNKFAEEMIYKLRDLINWISELSPTTLKWAAIMAGLAAAIGPVLFSIGMMAQGIGGISVALGLFIPLLAKMAALGSVVATIFAGITAPVWIAVAAITALVGVVTRLYFAWDRMKSAFKNSSGILSGIMNAGKVFFGFGDPAPSGESTKASQTTQTMVTQNTQTRNASVDVNISNLPQGSKVRSENVDNLSVGTAGMQGATI